MELFSMKKIFTQKNCVKATLECPMEGWEGGEGWKILENLIAGVGWRKFSFIQ